MAPKSDGADSGRKRERPSMDTRSGQKAGKSKDARPVQDKPRKAAPERKTPRKTEPKVTAAAEPASKPDLAAPIRAERTREREAAGKDAGMERYRIEVGLKHDVKPGNIVGAIANEAEIESEYIGRVEIFDDYSTVQLPEGMPREIFKHLKNVWVSGQRLQISRLDQKGRPVSRRPASDKAGAGGKPAGKKATKRHKQK